MAETAHHHHHLYSYMSLINPLQAHYNFNIYTVSNLHTHGQLHSSDIGAYTGFSCTHISQSHSGRWQIYSISWTPWVGFEPVQFREWDLNCVSRFRWPVPYTHTSVDHVSKRSLVHLLRPSLHREPIENLSLNNRKSESEKLKATSLVVA